MTQELTTISGGQIGVFDPDAQLEKATRAAKALSRIIAQKKKPVIINGEQYLEFEDWQTLGQFDGVTVRTGDAEPVEINGVQGVKAKAFLYNKHTGEMIGGAEAYCMRDEEKWGTRPKYEWQGEGANRKRVKVGDEVVPWFQLASMAQTRAGSKALRNKEAWIAVLAGFKPTPAEEMSENTVSEAVSERRTVDRTQHYCSIHDENFFRKGRMKNYAHPLPDSGGWCNEGDVDQGQREQAPTSTLATGIKQGIEAESSGTLPDETETTQENDDKQTDLILFIKEAMDEAKFPLKTLVSWAKSKAAYRGLDLSGTIEDIIGRMNQEQRQFLVKELEDRRQMR